MDLSDKLPIDVMWGSSSSATSVASSTNSNSSTSFLSTPGTLPLPPFGPPPNSQTRAHSNSIEAEVSFYVSKSAGVADSQVKAERAAQAHLTHERQLEGLEVDESCVDRRERNRMSARKSRLRKKYFVDALVQKVELLEKEVERLHSVYNTGAVMPSYLSPTTNDTEIKPDGMAACGGSLPATTTSTSPNLSLGLHLQPTPTPPPGNTTVPSWGHANPPHGLMMPGYSQHQQQPMLNALSMPSLAGSTHAFNGAPPHQFNSALYHQQQQQQQQHYQQQQYMQLMHQQQHYPPLQMQPQPQSQPQQYAHVGGHVVGAHHNQNVQTIPRTTPANILKPTTNVNALTSIPMINNPMTNILDNPKPTIASAVDAVDILRASVVVPSIDATTSLLMKRSSEVLQSVTNVDVAAPTIVVKKPRTHVSFDDLSKAMQVEGKQEEELIPSGSPSVAITNKLLSIGVCAADAKAVQELVASNAPFMICVPRQEDQKIGRLAYVAPAMSEIRIVDCGVSAGNEFETVFGMAMDLPNWTAAAKEDQFVATVVSQKHGTVALSLMRIRDQQDVVVALSVALKTKIDVIQESNNIDVASRMVTSLTSA